MSAGRGVRKVLLLGTHGQFNIGDELLLETFLTHLGPQHRYAVNSYAPHHTAAELGDRFDIEVFDTAASRWRLLKHILECDVVIFGGGSILKELNATTGRWRYSTLVMVLLIVLFSRIVARSPILMSNIGVGPIVTRRGRFLAKTILRQTSLTSVRDERSMSTCELLGSSPAKLMQLPDAAFVNRPEGFVTTRATEVTAGESSSPRPASLKIVLNLNHDIDDPDSWSPFLTTLAITLRQVANTRPIVVHALPMQAHFKADHDLAILRDFLATIPDLPSVIHDPANHLDVAAIIDRADVVVSERLHAIAIAAIIGRPVVPLVYNVKVRELANQLGLGERSIDVNHPVDPGVFADTILSTASLGLREGARLAMKSDLFRTRLDVYFGSVQEWIQDPVTSGWPSAVRTGHTAIER